MTDEQELDEAEGELAAQHIGVEAMERSPERPPDTTEEDEDEEPPPSA